MIVAQHVKPTPTPKSNQLPGQLSKVLTDEQCRQRNFFLVHMHLEKAEAEYKHSQDDLAVACKMEKQALAAKELEKIDKSFGERDLDIKDLLNSLAVQGSLTRMMNSSVVVLSPLTHSWR
jgi:hypothetical protein